MVVKRVSDLNIHRRSFITAIKGNVNDTFVDEDLCSYTFEQQLYLYLRNEGYERVYFYTRASGYNCYSFDKESLVFLFPSKTNNSTNDGRLLGSGRLKKTTNVDDNSNHIKEGKINNRPYYYVSNFEDSTLVKTVQEILKDTKHKAVIYFTSHVFSLNESQGFIDGIAQIMSEVAANQSENKLLFKYNSGGVFKADFFTELLNSPENNVYAVGLPDEKECENWLNTNRIEGLLKSENVFGFPYVSLIKRISRQRKRLDSLNKELKLNSVEFINSLRVEEFSIETMAYALSKIHGQHDNISIIIEKIVDWINEPEDEEKRPLKLMFAGPSGTGKTYTAKTISYTLKSRGFDYVYLPMNQYTNEADAWRLFGSSTGYVGSNDDPKLFAARKKSDKLVILFDEIEKAHESLFKTIMNLMDEGTLENGRGEQFDFRNSIIIFTTNLAQKELIEKKKELIRSNKEIDSIFYQDAITQIMIDESSFPPEIFGRIDCVFVYNVLDRSTVAEIVIEEIRKQAKRRGIIINKVSREILSTIADEASENIKGARPVEKLIKSKLNKILNEFKESKLFKPDGIYDLEQGYSIVKSDTTEIIKPEDASKEIINIEQDTVEGISLEEVMSTSAQQSRDNKPKVLPFDKIKLLEALKSVKGQQDNVAIIADEINTWIKDAVKEAPLVFMLAGTSGTGKTFTAETINAALKDYRMVKLNMNEYSSDADSWKLLGSSSGYMGSDEDSPIFAARRETPNLLILFDEIEKAHPSLFTTIMTLMEKGEMGNGHGEVFDFKQSIIVFTTNLAMKELLKLKKESVQNNIDPSSPKFQDAARDILKAAGLKDEISGRVTWVLVYNTLDAPMVAQIAMERIRKLGGKYGIKINAVHKTYLEEIAKQCADNNEGARPVNRMITRKLKPIFQKVCETNDCDPNVLYDVDEHFQIIPSSSSVIIPVESLNFNLGVDASESKTDSGPVEIKLSSGSFFESGYNYESYRKSIGLIELDNGNSGTGSGFLISNDGYILTCAHCTEAKKIVFVKDDDKEKYEAHVVYKNELIDIAVLKIDVSDMPYLSISDSVKPLKIGTEIVILGYPSGTDVSENVSAFEGKISNYIGGIKSYITDAIAAPGSSGGALIAKKDGKVYGVLRGGYKETLGVDINASSDIRDLFKQNDIVIEYN